MLWLALVLGTNVVVPCAPLEARPTGAAATHALHADSAHDWCGPAPAFRLVAPCPCGCESDGTPASGLVLAQPDVGEWPVVASLVLRTAAPPRRAPARPRALPDPIPIRIS